MITPVEISDDIRRSVDTSIGNSRKKSLKLAATFFSNCLVSVPTNAYYLFTKLCFLKFITLYVVKRYIRTTI